jgi:hypothetical protein
MDLPDFTQELTLLDPKEIRLRRETSGEVTLTLADGTTYRRVQALQPFPLSAESRLISLRDENDQEIGQLPDLRELDPDSRKVLEEELSKRYFMPQIRVIEDLKTNMGVMSWRVQTDRGPRRFEVRSRDDIRYLPHGRILLRDVDGNRYEIPNYRTLDPRSRDFLERDIV